MRLGQAAAPAAALRVLLLVSLWPAPVPWMHRHDDEVETPRLTVHLSEYHARESEDAHEGWHLHFAYLWRLAEDPECPEPRKEPPPSQLPAAPGASAPEMALVVVTAGATVFANISGGAPQSQPAGRAVERRCLCPGGFLNSFAGVIAPHQLLGVLLI